MSRLGTRLFFVAMLATAVPLGASKAFADSVQAIPVAHGVAVLAQGDAKDAMWPLAQGVYADPGLRPALDEKHARVLAGEKIEALSELGELRAGVKGDDAASRQLLQTIGERYNVQAIVVVSVDENGTATARTFQTSSKTFDAAVFVAKKENDTFAWPGAVDALHKQFAPTPPAAPVASSKQKEEPQKTIPGKPFYLSPWFWGALGAAVIGGLAIILATQDASGDTLKLQLKVPK